MATKVENPLDINKQLYDELQRTYPEVRADVIVHVMTENFNNPDRCTAALVQESHRCLYDPSGQQCSAPGGAPQRCSPSVTPLANVTQQHVMLPVTPNVTPNVISHVTPHVMSHVTPNVMRNFTPNVTPNFTPHVMTHVTPNVTPNFTPNVTPHMTHVAPNVTPNFTPHATQRIVSHVPPNVTPVVTPNYTPHVTPIAPMRMTPSATTHATTRVSPEHEYVNTMSPVATGVPQLPPRAVPPHRSKSADGPTNGPACVTAAASSYHTQPPGGGRWEFPVTRPSQISTAFLPPAGAPPYAVQPVAPPSGPFYPGTPTPPGQSPAPDPSSYCSTLYVAMQHAAVDVVAGAAAGAPPAGLPHQLSNSSMGSSSSGACTPPPLLPTPAQMLASPVVHHYVPARMAHSPTPGYHPTHTPPSLAQHQPPQPGYGATERPPLPPFDVFSHATPPRQLALHPALMSPMPTHPVPQMTAPDTRQPMDTYTNTLLYHQRMRMDSLLQDVRVSQSVLESLQDEVRSLERSVQRSNDDYPAFRDLELVRERNRVLSFEIEILTRHLDMLSNGTTPLGIVDPLEQQVFYDKIPTGQRGSWAVPPQLTVSQAPASTTGASVAALPAGHAGPAGGVGAPPADPDEGVQWSCSSCTFLNHQWLEKCELCEMPRVTVPRACAIAFT